MARSAQANNSVNRRRQNTEKAFTLAVIPAHGGFKREWRVTYATIYFIAGLLIATAGIIIFSYFRRPVLESDRKESAELTSGWVARWEILEHGKERITANLDDLKNIGEEYFNTIFHSRPDLSDIEASGPELQQRAKILPLMSVMRIISAREEAYISMPMGIPVRSNQITSLYGSRVDPFGLETSFHTGIDFAGGTGTPIYSTADGVVVSATDDGSSGLGKNVRVLHKFGFITAYAHMDAIATSKDKKVKRGDLLGFVGTTGRSTGPHLHYEVRIKNIEPENWFELTYNPMPFIREKL